MIDFGGTMNLVVSWTKVLWEWKDGVEFLTTWTLRLPGKVLKSNFSHSSLTE